MKKGFVGGFCGCFGVLAAVIVLIIIVAVIIGVAAGRHGQKKAASPQVQPIGTTQKVGDVEVTVYGTRYSVGDQYSQPKPGNRWVIVDVSAQNTGNNAYNLSSLLQIDLRDADGHKYNETYAPGTRGSFGGIIPVGGLVRGEVAFEVPLSAQGLTFVFGQSFGTEQAFWAVQ